MGSGNQKQKKLTQYELNEYANQSSLSYQQVENLYTFFKSISTQNKDDGVIDMEEFTQSLKVTSKDIPQSIFNVFDLNNDTVINFREFILGMSNLMGSNQEFQIKFAFNLIDQNKSQAISCEQIFTFIKQLLEQYPAIKIEDTILQKAVSEELKSIKLNYQNELNQGKLKKEQIVEKQQDELVNYQQFRLYVLNSPHILKWLQLDIEKLSKGATILSKKL